MHVSGPVLNEKLSSKQLNFNDTFFYVVVIIIIINIVIIIIKIIIIIDINSGSVQNCKYCNPNYEFSRVTFESTGCMNPYIYCTIGAINKLHAIYELLAKVILLVSK